MVGSQDTLGWKKYLAIRKVHLGVWSARLGQGRASHRFTDNLTPQLCSSVLFPFYLTREDYGIAIRPAGHHALIAASGPRSFSFPLG